MGLGVEYLRLDAFRGRGIGLHRCGHRAASLPTLRFRLSGSGVSAQRLAIQTPGLSLKVCILGAEGSDVQDLCG